ncbi:hypothetical protein T492DRAFT_962215 [Pavlovales sp. CCMP2436]|nr:hypothetical protein T492DRAFT_962215 [Pavlovales sp. CCMP2436]
MLPAEGPYRAAREAATLAAELEYMSTDKARLREALIRARVETSAASDARESLSSALATERERGRELAAEAAAAGKRCHAAEARAEALERALARSIALKRARAALGVWRRSPADDRHAAEGETHASPLARFAFELRSAAAEGAQLKTELAAERANCAEQAVALGAALAGLKKQLCEVQGALSEARLAADAARRARAVELEQARMASARDAETLAVARGALGSALDEAAAEHARAGEARAAVAAAQLEVKDARAAAANARALAARAVTEAAAKLDEARLESAESAGVAAVARADLQVLRAELSTARLGNGERAALDALRALHADASAALDAATVAANEAAAARADLHEASKRADLHEAAAAQLRVQLGADAEAAAAQRHASAEAMVALHTRLDQELARSEALEWEVARAERQIDECRLQAVEFSRQVDEAERARLTTELAAKRADHTNHVAALDQIAAAETQAAAAESSAVRAYGGGVGARGAGDGRGGNALVQAEAIARAAIANAEARAAAVVEAARARTRALSAGDGHRGDGSGSARCDAPTAAAWAASAMASRTAGAATAGGGGHPPAPCEGYSYGASGEGGSALHLDNGQRIVGADPGEQAVGSRQWARTASYAHQLEAAASAWSAQCTEHSCGACAARCYHALEPGLTPAAPRSRSEAGWARKPARGPPADLTDLPSPSAASCTELARHSPPDSSARQDFPPAEAAVRLRDLRARFEAANRMAAQIIGGFNRDIGTDIGVSQYSRGEL